MNLGPVEQQTGVYHVARFFPDAASVTDARGRFAEGRYADLDIAMHTQDLAWPHTDDLPALLDEFGALATELGLRDEDSGFIVLVPVRANGAILTTPVLVDLQRSELCFTSHPTFGAGVIPRTVIAENTQLASAIREQLLGVLSTWHNSTVEPEAV
jgi:hypothetical protein